MQGTGYVSIRSFLSILYTLMKTNKDGAKPLLNDDLSSSFSVVIDINHLEF